MNISVVGTGYVGLVVGACLAETGNDVVCADVDARKIDMLRANQIPIYEPGLSDLVERNRAQGRLDFTVDVPRAIAGSEVIFIAVGTPPDEDGSADLRHVLTVAETIGRHMTREVVIVTKSTVPVGTAAKVQATRSQVRAVSVSHVFQPRVPEGGRRRRRFPETRPRCARRRVRSRAQCHGGALRAVRAHRQARSSSWTSRPRR